MESLGSGVEGIAAGLAVGLSLGIGLFALRRFAWVAAQILGSIAAVGLIGGVLWWFAILARGQSQGGDAAMYTLLFTFAGGLGLLGVAAVSSILAWSQGVRYGRPFWESFLACIPDLVLAGAAVALYFGAVVSPMEKQTTDTWWQQELARRNRVESIKKGIPERYRNITSAHIDAHRRMQQDAAKFGQSVSPLVPQEVENRIRNYENEAMKPGPVPDRSGYAQARKLRAGFPVALGLSWLLCVLLLPALVRPKSAG